MSYQTTDSLNAKWTFLTIEPQAVFLSVGYVIPGVSDVHWTVPMDCVPPLELGPRSYRHPVLLVILRGFCTD